ncbi:MAG: DUF131 domain-containing protein [Candidatus Woesearchaeota archaeon]
MDLLKIGLLLIVLGIIFILISSLINTSIPKIEKERKADFAFTIFIGPFPIGISTNKTLYYFSIILGFVILMIIIYYLYLTR